MIGSNIEFVTKAYLSKKGYERAERAIERELTEIKRKYEDVKISIENFEEFDSIKLLLNVKKSLHNDISKHSLL